MTLLGQKIGFLIPLLLAFTTLSCTKSEHPGLKQLEKSFAEAQQAMSDIELAIKKVPETNQGLLLKLNQDKQLALSRLERIKSKLMAIAPDKVQAEGASESKH